MKHTKGKFNGTQGQWRLETVKDDNSGEVSEIYITQESGGCIVCINNGDDSYDIPTDLANAHLISAAPDLLQALIDLHKVCAMSNKETLAAAKAIKKALGN